MQNTEKKNFSEIPPKKLETGQFSWVEMAGKCPKYKPGNASNYKISVSFIAEGIQVSKVNI